MGLWRPLHKTLYEHNVLGGFLEAQDRKSALFTKKLEILPENQKFTENIVFVSKSDFFAEMRETSRSVTFFALNHKLL